MIPQVEKTDYIIAKRLFDLCMENIIVHEGTVCTRNHEEETEKIKKGASKFFHNLDENNYEDKMEDLIKFLRDFCSHNYSFLGILLNFLFQTFGASSFECLGYESEMVYEYQSLCTNDQN